jgi:osmotically-inducible protein OsmY
MRRFLFGVVIASVTAAMPAWAFGGDREIAKTVMSELQQYKDAGQLKGFDVNLKVEDGVVYLMGEVANRNQRALIAKAAASAAGSANVVNEIQIRQAANDVRTVSTDESNSPAVTDTVITDSIFDHLAQAKAAGQLRGFELDISTVNGDVWVRGSVANQEQKAMVLDVASRVPGVARVIDDVTVKGQNDVRSVSTATPPAPTPLPQGSSMPMMAPTGPTRQAGKAGPQAFAPSGLASYSAAAPVPAQYGEAGMGMGAPRYDQPNLPNYAWPSYAAYPNYAAVTYPKQYSPSAWPYIGPFYPYPQVPLGWRRVSLEWDDGLWYLDYSSKSGRR